MYGYFFDDDDHGDRTNYMYKFFSDSREVVH